MMTARADLEIPVDDWIWVESYLDSWARWMRDPELRLAAPECTPGFHGEIHDGYGDPQACHELAGEERAVQVIQATLYDLSPVECAAVMHVHLYAVFRFRCAVALIYPRARQAIGLRLLAADFFLESLSITGA